MKKVYSKPAVVFAPMSFDEHITAASGGGGSSTCTLHNYFGIAGIDVDECWTGSEWIGKKVYG